MLKITQTAADFTLPCDNGTEITLSQLRPAAVVLFFYPRDDTPGCTLEARDFTQWLPKFKALGAEVYGISKDSLVKHGKFRDKFDLTVPLLSDENSDVCENYGVWVEKKMYGKTFMGISRSTVLIDGAGKIARIWPKVKVAGHAQEVYESLLNLPK